MIAICLREGCPEFAGWWSAHDVRAAAAGEGADRVPVAGCERVGHDPSELQRCAGGIRDRRVGGEGDPRPGRLGGLVGLRLGLRAGDVAQLRLSDIEWQSGSLRVTGKSGTEVRLRIDRSTVDST